MLRKSFSSPVKRGFLFALLAAFSLLWLGQAHAERRAAIVVGNSEYPFAPLTNPRSDAKLIANTLTELNFDVLLFYDVKKSAAKDLKDAIRAHLVGADMAVFYYAGHALQYNGQNLLLPVDTRTSSAKEVVADAMMLNDLIDIVKDDPVGVKALHPRCLPQQSGGQGEGAAAGPRLHRGRQRPGARRLRHQCRRGRL